MLDIVGKSEQNHGKLEKAKEHTFTLGVETSG
jgi:hypothetical protein